MSAGDLYAFYLGAVHSTLCVCVCACAHMFTHIVPPFSHRVHTHTRHTLFLSLSLSLSLSLCKYSRIARYFNLSLFS